MRSLTHVVAAATLALLVAPAHAQGVPAAPGEVSAVVLSNGQRWERITLRHIDPRVLAPLFGATALPAAQPAWLATGFLPVLPAGWPMGMAALPLLQQAGSGALPPGVPGGGVPGGAGPANPAGLPVLIDPVTNALIVDP